MNIAQKSMKIAIIGAGFAGTALVAALHRLGKKPCDIILFEKSGRFGAGDAYRTPFPFHILNVRASDMSVFEDEPNHYVDWLRKNTEIAPYLQSEQPLADLFTPRIFYGTYLKQLLEKIQSDQTHFNLQCEATEVVDIISKKNSSRIMMKDGREMVVDKVVFAIGNHTIQDFPFSVAEKTKCIKHAWDYLAPTHIPADAPVMIVGTGLSMIDTVQTLYHHGHRGKIYAVSRHGLLPMLHADSSIPFQFEPTQANIDIRLLTKYLRATSSAQIEIGGDWRTVVNAMRSHVPALWSRINARDKKRFMRHLAPYWNVHRHRVPAHVSKCLDALYATDQLEIIAGHIISVDTEKALIRQRKTGTMLELPVKYLINCMGPSNNLTSVRHPLMQALIEKRVITIDELGLGFSVADTGALKSANGKVSSVFYTLGSSRRGAAWEAGAVPEIRKQSYDLAQHLLGMI